MRALPEALRISPPTKYGTTDVDLTFNATQKVAISATTAASGNDSGFTGDVGGCYITITCTKACLFCFAPTAALAVATADDWPLEADQPLTFWIEKSRRYFGVFGGAEAGTFKWRLG